MLDQFAPDFPAFCKVGTGHNDKIDYEAKGFISVTKSVDLLQNVSFDAILVDEAHHPLPPGLPKCENMFQFSATLGDNTEFNYSMGQAIEDGILCDYDITVPAITAHHAYVCLADLLLKQAGRFRRVLAYCNSVAEAKKFQIVLQELGLAAWHINAFTTQNKRKQIMDEFTGVLWKPVHVLVTVEVLGEGMNIPNADTCMFVEPRNSYRSIVQAIGRVLRHHPSKAIAHIVLPAFATPPPRSGQLMPVSAGVERDARQEHSEVFEPFREPPFFTGPLNLQKAKMIESRCEDPPAVQDVRPSSQPKQSPSCIARGSTHQTGFDAGLAKSKQEFRTKNCTSQGKQPEGVQGAACPGPQHMQLAEADNSQVYLGICPTATRTRKKQAATMNFQLIEGDDSHVGEYGKECSSQLERFLSVLILADQRLVGTNAAHRIQVIDCRKSSSIGLGMHMLEDVVYEQLRAILHQTDLWEWRLQRLEEFAESWGRLPSQHAKTAHEKTLANWFKRQGWLWRKGELEAQRWKCLLATSSHLIGCRLAKWMLGENAETVFRQKCKELNTYIETHGHVPYVSNVQGNVDLKRNKLAVWLENVRQRNQHGTLPPSRRRDLQEVHPLVADLPDQWDAAPIRLNLEKWDIQLEKVTSFVLKHGRLPRAAFGEHRDYVWLHDETRRFIADKLPAGCIEKMQRAHPLIAEKIQQARDLKRGGNT